MNISNNLNNLHTQELKLNEISKNISKLTNNEDVIENSNNITTSLTKLIPTTIAYEASLKGIKVQNEIEDTLLNIKV